MSTVTARHLTEPLLEESRAYCEDLTRREARNFYYGLKLLPEPKRSAMYALYAYMRLVDDIADEEDGRDIPQRIADLDAWRRQTLAVVAGDPGALSRHILWPAFAEMIRRYHIPVRILEDMIDGQRQDLHAVAINTFHELYGYCYRVASVVGLASIHVWGFEGGKATEELAINRGIAFQLTNVLRDLREDAHKGRTYLPREDLERFGVDVPSLLAGTAQGAAEGNFLALMRFQIDRAAQFYADSAPLDGLIEKDSRPTLRAMTNIYRGLLDRIAEDPQRVLRERIRLSTWTKLIIGWRAMRMNKGDRIEWHFHKS